MTVRQRSPVTRRVALVLAMGLAGLGSMSTAPIGARTAGAQPGVFQTMRAADFLQSLGVNIHIGSDPYNDPADLARKLRYVGIEHVRQSSPIDAAGLARMQALGRSGAKFALIVNGGGPVDLGGAMRTVHDMAPYLSAVEGVNEAAIYPISYKGVGGIDAAVALQKDLWNAVRASRALDHAAVFMFTIGGADPKDYPSIGDLSAYADYANVHSYPPHGLRPIFVIHAAIAAGRMSAARKPVVVTETGYYTLPNHDAWGGVPESVQAGYLLGLLLDQAASGVARTYLYDLIDDGPDPARTNREDNFGLFRFDGTPKLAATALHNLTAILSDVGPDARTFRPTPLAGTALGVPYDHTGNTLAFEKRDGTRVLVLWNQQQLWDPDTRTARPAVQVPVTVTFPRPMPSVQVHDPLLGIEKTAEYHDAATLTVELTDHPILLVIKPASATAR